MKRHLHLWAALAALVLALPAVAAEAFTSGPGWLEFPASKGPGAGKHVVLLAGDEEYRSEESMPMLARILAERHGFKCTVLFSHDDGVINPKNGASLGKPEVLDTADALVLGLRFRKWNEAALAKFDAAIKRGVPIVATRTSTHAFAGIPKESAFVAYNWNNKGGFGKNVLGESWVSHWGNHKSEATRTAVEAGAENLAVLNGVGVIFGDTDVYEAYPPSDAQILLRGQVLKGMGKDDPLSERVKKRNTDKQEQGVNSPAMAVAWTREVPNAGGTKNRVLTTTMASASDLVDELAPPPPRQRRLLGPRSRGAGQGRRHPGRRVEAQQVFLRHVPSRPQGRGFRGRAAAAPDGASGQEEEVSRRPAAAAGASPDAPVLFRPGMPRLTSSWINASL
jgi:hypothetical protein